MSYRLRNDLTFCQIDGHLIFLDILNDRYFRLSAPMEQAFIRYIDGDQRGETDVNALINLSILTKDTSTEDYVSTTDVTAPIRSAVEQPSTVHTVNFFTLLEVITIVYATKRQLSKKRNFKDIVNNLMAYREKLAKPSYSDKYGTPPQSLLDAARIFRHARLYVPVETSCLLDSLSMVKFLARRRLPANIIFGVTCDPFAAHCWVQSGDCVLNDTVGNAMAHTPIWRV